MANFVQLESSTGSSVVVNADAITYITPHNQNAGITVIRFDKDQHIVVTGGIDEVVLKLCK